MRVLPFSYLEQRVAGGPPPEPTLWTPADITTYTWIDAADASSVTLSAGRVESVTDKSGNGHDLIQTIETSRRCLYNTGINSLNCLDYTGTEVMYLDDNNGDNTTVMFFVADTPTATPPSNRALTRRGYGSPSLGYTLRFTPSGLGGQYRIGTTQRNLTNTTTPSIPGIYEADLIYDGTNTTLSSYVTANEVTAPTAYAGALRGQTDDVKPVIGGAYASDNWGASNLFSDFFIGNIGEVIYLTSTNATTTNIQLTQGYLAWKWGLEGDLPIGHPYKNAAPMV
jgi:hypothetical protein